MSNPVRMCITCKGRFEQNVLIRLQCKNKIIQKYDGMGRSFYICRSCVNEKKTLDVLLRVCKLQKTDKNMTQELLKEILVDT